MCDVSSFFEVLVALNILRDCLLCAVHPVKDMVVAGSFCVQNTAMTPSRGIPRVPCVSWIQYIYIYIESSRKFQRITKCFRLKTRTPRVRTGRRQI